MMACRSAGISERSRAALEVMVGTAFGLRAAKSGCRGGVGGAKMFRIPFRTRLVVLGGLMGRLATAVEGAGVLGLAATCDR